MLERPDLSDETIRRCLQANYGIDAAEITFLPIGYDATASVFRVDAADGQPFFLKVKSVAVPAAPLAVPHFLRQMGIDAVVAPLATRSNALSTPLDGGFTAILYPFLNGRMGMDGGLSEAQWITLGRTLRQIHGAKLSSPLAAQMRRERFAPLKGELAWSLHEEVARAVYADPIRADLADFWRQRRAEIERILRRAEALGHMAEARQPEIVLCHADIHIFNVLVDPVGGLHIVDWDETILAPKERDLMFLVEDAASAREALDPSEVAFRQGYGPVEIDPVILAFYRYEWAVQEIAEFGKQVLRAEDGGEITQMDGLRHFRALFDAGDVVEKAYRADGSSFAPFAHTVDL
ncbi:MAG: phosphotransferase [Caldilineaceae bacterium]|nr:phosphotransferase [Caldilineaceae bacterium]